MTTKQQTDADLSKIADDTRNQVITTVHNALVTIAHLMTDRTTYDGLKPYDERRAIAERFAELFHNACTDNYFHSPTANANTLDWIAYTIEREQSVLTD